MLCMTRHAGEHINSDVCLPLAIFSYITQACYSILFFIAILLSHAIAYYSLVLYYSVML
jgi:hypothetical protein